MSDKVISADQFPTSATCDFGNIDWNEIDVDGFEIPTGKADRQKLLRVIRDELTVRIERHKAYVIAKHFEKRSVSPPDPATIRTDGLLNLMTRFPIVRSHKR
ncbi:hypothetical protein AB4Z25_24865 [Rhizobium sp. RAF36]|uniref:hypothetical protein n=1 Tax=Rhizobium sp. RAF36 TaxID=3233055 RepID=UPI003F982FE0